MEEHVLQKVIIKPCSLGTIREYIEKNHYSHSVLGITASICFEVVLRDNPVEQVGAAIFGWPGQIQTEQKYGEYDSKTKRYKYSLLELRRFHLVDSLPRNAESYILGKIFQRLAILGVDRIYSCADPNAGHTGLIYRATGFHVQKQNKGKTGAYRLIEDFTCDGKTFKKNRRLPIRNLDQYINYRVSPSKCPPAAAKVLNPVIAADYEDALRKGEFEGKPQRYAIVRQDRTSGAWVFVIKTEKYLTSLSKRLRKAIEQKKAVWQEEERKIVYIKDLQPKMPYFLPPKKETVYEPNTFSRRNKTQNKAGLAEREAPPTKEKSERPEPSDVITF